MARITRFKRYSQFSMAEALALIGLWGFGFGIVWLIVTNYHGEQSVSLENAIFYVVAALTILSLAILFRDAIANRMTRRDEEMVPAAERRSKGGAIS